jgi:hypothetical protein
MRVRLPVAACAGLVALCAICVGIGAARPAAKPTHAESAVEQRMSAVVHAWSDRLNAGDNNGVARLFAVPALLVQAPYEYRLTTRAEIAAWHAGLPCAGHVVSITFRGRNATAVFRLGNRKFSKCDAPGKLAAARFTIVNGKIVMWEQVPVPQQRPKTPTA